MTPEAARFPSYRCDGEGLVQDAVVDQLLVDVACCLAHALRGGNIRHLGTHAYGVWWKRRERRVRSASPCERSRLLTLPRWAGSHIQPTGLSGRPGGQVEGGGAANVT